MPGKLAFILGGAPSGDVRETPDFAAEERKSRKRALALALQAALGSKGGDVDELVAAVEDAFSGFMEDQE